MSDPATAEEGTAEAVAATLVAARRDGRALGGFPGATPAGMAEAYRIQDAAIDSWPDTLVGWKIGFIAPDRRASGEPDRLVGPIWSRGRHASDGPPVGAGIFAAGFAAVEAEFVVRLEQDLPAREGAWTAAEVAELDQQLLVGIEVASSPIPDINALGPRVIAADFGNNNGLLLGPELASPAGVELACLIDGVLVGEGTADNLPGGLHHGLATALDLLAERGHAVRAGTVFATGAITGIHEIRPGQHCRVEIRGSGSGEAGPSLELWTVDLAPSAG
jgi:2-keto-4-pentenoate hydratase